MASYAPDHITFDPQTGSIRVTLEHLYETLIEWHIDEDTDRDDAAVYARRFVMRVLDIDVLAEAKAIVGVGDPGVGRDLEREVFDRLTGRLPGGTLRRLREIEAGEDD